jgi:hypothetical protein
VGINWNGTTPEVASVDPATGILTVLGPAPAVSLYIGYSAYDHATKRLYEFNETEVYAIDGVTGAVLFTTPLPMATWNKYSNPSINQSGAIVVLDYAASAWSTATLDPLTGSLTSLAPVPYSGGFYDAVVAFDRTRNLIYEFGDTAVVTVDGASGVVLAKVPPADMYLGNPVVNIAGEIIGIHDGAGPWHTARLDPKTGSITDLAPYANVGVEMGGAAYDPCTNRIYQFIGFNVITVDGTTGVTLATVPLAQQSFGNFQAVW